jgi:hypothetical protein
MQRERPIAAQDALSKTIPIWAATLNQAVYEHRIKQGPAVAALQTACHGATTAASSAHDAAEDERVRHSAVLRPPDWDTTLHTPLFITSTERASMEARLPGFVAQLRHACGDSLPGCLVQLKKPLRPLWISQASHIVINHIAPPEHLHFHPILLVSASLPALYLRKPIRLPGHDGTQAECSGTYMFVLVWILQTVLVTKLWLHLHKPIQCFQRLNLCNWTCTGIFSACIS